MWLLYDGKFHFPLLVHTYMCTCGHLCMHTSVSIYVHAHVFVFVHIGVFIICIWVYAFRASLAARMRRLPQQSMPSVLTMNLMERLSKYVLFKATNLLTSWGCSRVSYIYNTFHLRSFQVVETVEHYWCCFMCTAARDSNILNYSVIFLCVQAFWV